MVVRQEEWRYWAFLATIHVLGIAFLLLLGAVFDRSVLGWLVPLAVVLTLQYAAALRRRRRRWSDPPRFVVGSDRIGWGPPGAETWVAWPTIGAADVGGLLLCHVRLLGTDGATLHRGKYAFYGFYSPAALKEALRSVGLPVA